MSDAYVLTGNYIPNWKSAACVNTITGNGTNNYLTIPQVIHLNLGQAVYFLGSAGEIQQAMHRAGYNQWSIEKGAGVEKLAVFYCRIRIGQNPYRKRLIVITAIPPLDNDTIKNNAIAAKPGNNGKFYQYRDVNFGPQGLMDLLTSLKA